MKYTDQEAWEIIKQGMAQTVRPQALALSTLIIGILTGDAKRFPDYDSFADYLEEALSEQGRKELAMAIVIKLKREGELENV